MGRSERPDISECSSNWAEFSEATPEPWPVRIYSGLRVSSTSPVSSLMREAATGEDRWAADCHFFPTTFLCRWGPNSSTSWQIERNGHGEAFCERPGAQTILPWLLMQDGTNQKNSEEPACHFVSQSGTESLAVPSSVLAIARRIIVRLRDGRHIGGELQWKSRNDCDWGFGGDEGWWT